MIKKLQILCVILFMSVTKLSATSYDGLFNELAKIYYYFYKANNRKLIIVPHREFDRGVSGAHDDPTNFDFKKFYKILQNSYNIIIIEGTDGIEQSRYEKPNQGDNIHSFPPILSGPIKRKK